MTQEWLEKQNKPDAFLVEKTVERKEKIVKTILAVSVWFLFWFANEGIFLLSRHDVINLDFIGSASWKFFFITLWAVLFFGVAFFIWSIKIKNWLFLKCSKKVFILYLIPFVLLIKVLISGETFGVLPILYVLGIIFNSLLQDILTFGFLQTYLEKVLNTKAAFLIVVVAFYIAHLDFSFSVGSLFLVAGYILFGYLRFRFKHIYFTNVVHLSYLLL